ncbi:MAG TPA: tRNA pseudouridine(55) synthase TruB [Geobacteraceae bacterium]|nr:tRNA pseudouridine(55) synthase TruB [Geobacteraceae bacterium]
MNGFLVFDKPADMTSHDVVAMVRRLLKQKKVGHTGTLDPFATGVLPVALGTATKLIPYLDESLKEYRAVMYLGISTDTQDHTGKVVRQEAVKSITEEMIRETFARFTGTISQVPPMFSAVKQGGVPLYKLARRGEEVERPPRQVTIYSLALNRLQLPYVTFTVHCSRGTYVRALANDLGDSLGCGAHLTALRRLRSGVFSEELAITLETMQECSATGRFDEHLITPLKALSHLRALSVTYEGSLKISHGMSPAESDFETYPEGGVAVGETVCLIHEGRLAAVASGVPGDNLSKDKTVRLLRVFI